MPQRNRFLFCQVALACAILLLLAGNANAYVGPGAGLELVGYFMSLVAWLLAAFSALLLYPIYSLIRRLRGRKTPDSAVAEQEPGGSAQ